MHEGKYTLKAFREYWVQLELTFSFLYLMIVCLVVMCILLNIGKVCLPLNSIHVQVLRWMLEI